jgi:mannosyl-oligosaccharide alpha-1,2-mannosidase
MQIPPIEIEGPTMRPHQKSSRIVLERILPLTFPVVLVVVLLLLFILPSGNNLPALGPIVPHLDRKEAIRSAFDFAWDGYYTLAFPHDELKPLSNSPGYSRNDWGATAVDALGTAILMGKLDIVNIVLAHIKTIDFNNTNTPISVFESTIRYMGGLLSAYELLTGPFASLSADHESINALLDQAKSLGDILSAAFVDGNALPSGVLTLHNLDGNGKNSLAGAGTMVSGFQ